MNVTVNQSYTYVKIFIAQNYVLLTLNTIYQIFRNSLNLTCLRNVSPSYNGTHEEL